MKIGPILILGMHRSGTSLVCRLLRDAGAHLGRDLNSHLESRSFLGANQQIFRAADAAWDHPRGVERLLRSRETVEALADELSAGCRRWPLRRYLGWRRLLRLRPLGAPGDVWGFKDPRSTFTLPVWLRVFPSARVVCVRRHPADVVASLLRRERERGPGPDPARSERCRDPGSAFELWAEYAERAAAVLASLPPERVLQVGFEELLGKPLAGVQTLLAFAGLGGEPDVAGRLAAVIDPGRSRAFRNDPELVRLHAARASHPLVRLLGYDRP